MRKTARFSFVLIPACVMIIAFAAACSLYGDRTGFYETDTFSEDKNVILFLKDDKFVVTEYGSLSDKPSEILAGNYSLKGMYEGEQNYTPFLYTDSNKIAFKPLKTYRVSFDYRVLKKEMSGFEVLFYSPEAASKYLWLPSFEIDGKAGTEGTAVYTCTLGDFTDYELRWNIISSGAIVIDNVHITNVETKEVLASLDIEAERAVINVSHESIQSKISNKPTIPLFCPWGTINRTDTDKNTAGPYSLIWTSRGLSYDVESVKPRISTFESYQMQNDLSTLYLISPDWCAWMPSNRNLSQRSPFYLNEVFKPHIGSEYSKTFVINFEHRDWPSLMAAKARNYKRAGFDGLMFDWWNNDAGNGRSKKKVQSVRLSILKEIRKEAGNDFILMGNVNWNTDDSSARYLSGVFAELWKGKPDASYVLSYEEEKPEKGIFSVQRLEDFLLHWNSVLQWPKIIAVEPWKITRGDYIADRMTDKNLKLAQLFAAMTCVIPENGYFLYADNNGDSPSGDHGHAYYAFYRTDFGKSISPMTRIATGAAYKEYERGFIAYNRTNQPIDFKVSNGRQFHLDPVEGAFWPK